MPLMTSTSWREQCQWQSSRSGRDGVQQMQFMSFDPAAFLAAFFSPHVGLLCQPALSTGLCFFRFLFSLESRASHLRKKLDGSSSQPLQTFHSSFFLSSTLSYLSISPSSSAGRLTCSLLCCFSLLCTVVNRCPFVDNLLDTLWFCLVLIELTTLRFTTTAHFLLQSWLLIKNLSPFP